jgi:hypothetical protein
MGSPNRILLQMLSEQLVIRQRLIPNILENIRTSGLFLTEFTEIYYQIGRWDKGIFSYYVTGTWISIL